MTIYDETKVSRCHIPYAYNILHPVNFYHFQSYTKLFRAGNVNINIPPDPLYFSIGKVILKRYQNVAYGRWKQLKLCVDNQEEIVYEM